MGSRRLSQAISEGDGISVIVTVSDAASARAAQAQGAEALALSRPVDGLRTASDLPILFRGAGSLEAARRAGTDGCLVVLEELGEDLQGLEELRAEADRLGLELVVDVHDDEELQRALERVDPEIFLISPRGAEEDEAPLDRVLALLPDVPAGKLAIAEVAAPSREEVLALERAGFDAVLVGVANVAELVGGAPPAV